MGLIVKVLDEHGNSVGTHVADDQRDFERLLPDLSDPSYRCLGFIDPYGDTVFNARQIGDVRAELRKLRGNARRDAGSLIDEIDALARKVEQEPHLYLKFVGD